MANRYEKVFSDLLDLVRGGKEFHEKYHKNIRKSIGAIINLGDSSYAEYSSMVEANELRVASAIEKLAVSLFIDNSDPQFSFYPVQKRYEKLPLEEQAKSRPFQIILTADGMKTGIVFSVSSDVGRYYRMFIQDEYDVERLIIVRLIDPDEEAYDAIIARTNQVNEGSGHHLKHMTLKEFWVEHFGEDEYNALVVAINQFNNQAQEIIGFSTVVTPTDAAINRFRETTGKMLRERTYSTLIPTDVYYSQVHIMEQNYLTQGRWQAMIGKKNFAISFITSEWYFMMHQLTESFDLTWVAAGYLKSVEQLLYAVIELSEGTGITIRSTDRMIIEFSKENESQIDSTLGSLKAVVEHNLLLEVNRYAREHIINTIEDWRKKKRNGFFHKDVLQSIDQLKEIREAALQLYFLILGSFTIDDSQLIRLGVIN